MKTLQSGLENFLREKEIQTSARHPIFGTAEENSEYATPYSIYDTLLK